MEGERGWGGGRGGGEGEEILVLKIFFSLF